MATGRGTTARRSRSTGRATTATAAAPHAATTERGRTTRAASARGDRSRPTRGRGGDPAAATTARWPRRRPPRQRPRRPRRRRGPRRRPRAMQRRSRRATTRATATTGPRRADARRRPRRGDLDGRPRPTAQPVPDDDLDTRPATPAIAWGKDDDGPPPAITLAADLPATRRRRPRSGELPAARAPERAARRRRRERRRRAVRARRPRSSGAMPATPTTRSASASSSTASAAPRLAWIAVAPARRAVRDRGLRRVIRRASDQDLRGERDGDADRARALRARQGQAPRRCACRSRCSASSCSASSAAARKLQRLLHERRAARPARLHPRARRRDGGARIELRQLGVRDEAKAVGGIGSCGLTLCCTTWLPDFVPVSIKMAKDQGLVLSPTKVVGPVRPPQVLPGLRAGRLRRAAQGPAQARQARDRARAARAASSRSTCCASASACRTARATPRSLPATEVKPLFPPGNQPPRAAPTAARRRDDAGDAPTTPTVDGSRRDDERRPTRPTRATAEPTRSRARDASAIAYDPSCPTTIRAPPHDPDLLHHDADLLRQRRPAPRPRLHDDRRRRARALPPHARRRHAVPDRHRRARPEGRGGRRRSAGSRRSSSSTRSRRGSTRPGRRSASTDYHFIRTTERRATSAWSRALWKRIRATNPDDLYLASYQGWYCVGCEAFYTESQLVKDGDTWVLHDPQDAGRVARQGAQLVLPAVEVRRAAARAHRGATPTFIRPDAYRNEIVAFLQGRARATSRCRARASQWGIPVPEPDPDGLHHVIYVWMDALTNYLSDLCPPDGDDRRPRRRAATGRRRST